MACQEYDTCTDCVQDNPCYNNTGCLNPTTFECVTEPGNWPTIGVNNSMNGKEVMEALSQLVVEPHDDKYVKNSPNDSTAGYLSNKIVDTSTIKKSTVAPGSNEKLKLDVVISGDDGNIIQNIGNGLYASSNSDTYKTKVTAATTEDYLGALIEKGTDPLGIVSLDIKIVGGKIRIIPTINIQALCTALTDSGCLCSSPSNLGIS